LYRELRADDRAQAGLLRRLVKPRQAIDAIGIEQGERGIAKRRRAFDQRFRQRGALEEAEGGRSVEFDIHGWQ
jgi:hypothetical protein